MLEKYFGPFSFIGGGVKGQFKKVFIWSKNVKFVLTFRRDSILGLNKGYKDYTIGLNPSSLSWLADIFELRKGLIIWVAKTGRGIWKIFGVPQKCLDICFSIIESLYLWQFTLWNSF